MRAGFFIPDLEALAFRPGDEAIAAERNAVWARSDAEDVASDLLTHGLPE